MVRVAAVAKQICDHTETPIDSDAVITGCLLHDMGNLIKVKFEVEPALFEPEGVGYWQEAQAGMIETYGASVHDATIAIIQDVGVSKKVLEIVDEASFGAIVDVAKTGSLEAKILEYADMRVGLTGIISLKQRFDDIRDRYVPYRFTDEELNQKYEAAQHIETEIFAITNTVPDDITDVSTKALQAELWNWEI